MKQSTTSNDKPGVEKVRINNKYPFKDMVPGDSFPAAVPRGLYNAARYYGMTNGKKFLVLKVEEDGWNGYRCWRME